MQSKIRISHRKTWITLNWNDISKHKVQEHVPTAIKISQSVCVIDWKLISWKDNKEGEGPGGII